MRGITKAEEDRAKREFESIRDGSRKELSLVCQKYLKALVDTRAAPKVGVPTLVGGYPGRTGIERYTNQLEVITGEQNFGFLSLNLIDGGTSTTISGPFSDTNTMEYSMANYSAAAIPHAGNSPAGDTTITGWTAATRSMLAPNVTAEQFQWRLVGCTVKIFPDSSFSDQNGRIALYEPPGHAPLNRASDVVGTLIESAPTTRVVRGVQTGSQREQIVLNWHPRASNIDVLGNPVVSNQNDLAFTNLGWKQQTSTGARHVYAKDGVICFFAKKETSFHVEVTAMYEVRGRSVTDVAPRLTDSRGMDLVMNMLSHKLISGYVGVPERVYESYLHQAWKSAKEMGGTLKKGASAVSDVLTTIAGFL